MPDPTNVLAERLEAAEEALREARLWMSEYRTRYRIAVGVAVILAIVLYLTLTHTWGSGGSCTDYALATGAC